MFFFAYKKRLPETFLLRTQNIIMFDMIKKKPLRGYIFSFLPSFNSKFRHFEIKSLAPGTSRFGCVLINDQFIYINFALQFCILFLASADFYVFFCFKKKLSECETV